MRNTISLLLLVLSFSGFGQRISFEDPDLTFSFKKPKDWQVFDDGYVVKISPSAQDTVNIYFSITYFEDAEPLGASLFNPVGENQSNESGTLKIDGQPAVYHKKTEAGVTSTSYTFKKYDQRFELVTASKESVIDRSFKKIIRSIRITK